MNSILENKEKRIVIFALYKGAAIPYKEVEYDDSFLGCKLSAAPSIEIISIMYNAMFVKCKFISISMRLISFWNTFSISISFAGIHD